MQSLKDRLGIRNEFTKSTREKYFNKVKDNIPLVANYNFMADLLFLPTTKEGYKYLLVMVDLASDKFDIEPIKNKESRTVLKAMLNMFDRGILRPPYASLRTDAGTEFMGIFHKWLYDHSIVHKIALPGRHTQMANVERLNRTLGELFNGYMNNIEENTGAEYREWTDILEEVRNELNTIRKKTLPININSYVYPAWDGNNIEPKFKVGDLVYVKLNEPRNALGYKQNTKAFRVGDYRWSKEPRIVKQVLYYTGRVPYRYIVNTLENVSFTEQQLKLAVGHAEEKYVIKAIIGQRKIKGEMKFLVWWQGYLKKDATWEPATEIERAAPLLVTQYLSLSYNFANE